MNLPVISGISFWVVPVIILITIVCVVIISKCFNTKSKQNAQNMAKRNIDELRQK